MATEIVRWCDAHIATDERVPAGAHAVQLDGKSGTVDLCTDHAKVLLGPLLDLMAPAPKAAKPPKAGRPQAPGAVRCFLCDETMRAERMIYHLKVGHDTTSRPVYGNACPICGETKASAQGVAQHGRARHGFTTLVDMWQSVEDAGDPDGVVAARRALVAP